MGDKTEIQWTQKPGYTGATWNPVRGCTRVSPGCENCYAEKRAHRIFAQQTGMAEKAKREGKAVRLPLAYEGTTRVSKSGEPRWTGKIQFAPHLLDQPLRWQKPRLIFSNSMSDLFHPEIPFTYIAACFGVMAAADHHVFQVLTKRPERAMEFFAWLRALSDSAGGGAEMEICINYAEEEGVDLGERIFLGKWPLPNVWLGVSIESDAYRANRLDALRQIPNAMPWVSQEPQLAEVTYTAEELSWLRWIVVGGESDQDKTKARPFHLDWARKTIAQCAEANVPCFVKQVGTIPYQDDEFPEGTEFVGTKVVDGEDKPGLCFWRDKKGGDMDTWPEELRVRQWPEKTAA